jgi:hypothetical protein
MPESAPGSSPLEPASLPYLRDLPAFLRRTDPALWEWFARSVADSAAAQEVKFELLKSTYRIERAAQPELYRQVEEVAGRLGIEAEMTLYQAQSPHGLNASLATVPGEVHLIFHGPVASRLTPIELCGLLGHELSHYRLLQQGGGELLITRELLRSLLEDPAAHPSHFASWRLFHLYSEIFCDRGAYLAADDLTAVVSMLVKVHTDAEEVSPEGYLRQADEVFARQAASSEEVTHPEAFIRARALRLWAEEVDGAAAEIERMIEGTPALDLLDLLGQERVATATRRVLDRLLAYRFLRTDLLLAHARLFFDGYEPPLAPLPEGETIPPVPASLHDYYAFVLLDFASADRDLEEAPLAAALEVAEELGLKPRFAELAQRELKLRKGQIEKIDARRGQILADAERSVTAPR